MRAHRPRIDLDGRGTVAIHGHQNPVRGVWHSTECGDLPGVKDLAAVDDFWVEQGRGYGAHVIIDEDGNSALCCNPDQIAWAVENHNTGTVSIELIGYAKFGLATWLSRPKQLDKLARWMAWLRLEYGIPLVLDVDKGWSRHLDQSLAYHGSHSDPGTGFPRRYVLRKAKLYYQNGWV